MRGFTGACFVRLLTAIGLVAAMSATTAGQTLGELAKKEEARRKSVKSSGKVLTNDSLGQAKPSPLPPASSQPAPAPATAEKAVAEAKKPEVDRKAEEAAWRQRVASTQDSLQRSQTFAEALQSRINALTADFAARDDPAQRAVIANERQKALTELDRVKNDIALQTKAMADMREEARRAGVPPGWLR